MYQTGLFEQRAVAIDILTDGRLELSDYPLTLPIRLDRASERFVPLMLLPPSARPTYILPVSGLGSFLDNVRSGTTIVVGHRRDPFCIEVDRAKPVAVRDTAARLQVMLNLIRLLLLRGTHTVLLQTRSAQVLLTLPLLLRGPFRVLMAIEGAAETVHTGADLRTGSHSSAAPWEQIAVARALKDAGIDTAIQVAPFLPRSFSAPLLRRFARAVHDAAHEIRVIELSQLLGEGRQDAPIRVPSPCSAAFERALKLVERPQMAARSR